MPVPTRLGLVTANTLARKIIRLLTTYRPLLVVYLTPTQLSKVDSLVACCELFISDVPMYPPDPT